MRVGKVVEVQRPGKGSNQFIYSMCACLLTAAIGWLGRGTKMLTSRQADDDEAGKATMIAVRPKSNARKPLPSGGFVT